MLSTGACVHYRTFAFLQDEKVKCTAYLAKKVNLQTLALEYCDSSLEGTLVNARSW